MDEEEKISFGRLHNSDKKIYLLEKTIQAVQTILKIGNCQYDQLFTMKNDFNKLSDEEKSWYLLEKILLLEHDLKILKSFYDKQMAMEIVLEC